MAGVFDLELERGGDDPAAFLRALPSHIEFAVADLVDDTAEYGGMQLRAHAPGSIPGLVEVEGASALDPGVIEAIAGVTPAHDEGAGVEGVGKTTVETGSNPDDYPLFVDVGTGVFGEFRTPITIPVPHKMVIPPGGGYPSKTFTREIKGQEAQRYSDAAFEDTANWVPTRIARMKLPSGGG